MPQNLIEFWKNAPDDPLVAFLRVAPVFMHMTDADGRILHISAFWARFLGYEVVELIGRRSVELLSPESRTIAETEMFPRFFAEGQIHDIEYDFVKKTGEFVPMKLSATRIPGEDGKLDRSLAILFDNSAAKAAEQELLLKAREAEEASRAKSRFLAAMSHEIRTPMNAILGFAQLLRLSNLDDKRKGHVDAIIRAGGSLMNLLTDLLDLSHLEEGRMRIEPRDIDLPGLIDQVADWWISSAQNKGLKLSVSVDASLPARVRTDPVRLQQVLNNFLGNAVKFTESGGIVLRATLVGTADGSARIRFEVEDTGPGMDAAQIDQLFKPFVQIETDFGKERGGWGLGLSICANIAGRLGADIGVQSAPGEGATFFFELDVDIAEQAEAPVAAPLVPPYRRRSRRLRILVAEDDVLNRDMLNDFLTNLGHSVATASNGFQAVEASMAEPFDLILMDVMMPGLDGLSATEQIRSGEASGRDVPIIACSAHVADEAQARFRRAGMNAFLPKPIDRDRLEAAIDLVAGG